MNGRKTGINQETDMGGDLQIGPTTLGMVRIFVAAANFELPMDFTPEDAEDIAAEILDAAARARAQAQMAAPARKKAARGPKGGPAGRPGRTGSSASKPRRRT